ncbi:MAG: hypothetical protein QXP01_05490 [Candidatus Hadarchaeum sp.]
MTSHKQVLLQKFGIIQPWWGGRAVACGLLATEKAKVGFCVVGME